MPKPFLHLGDVGFMGQGVSGGSGSQRVDTQAWDGLQQTHPTCIMPNNILI